MRPYLLFDYGTVDYECNGFSCYLGSFDTGANAENYYASYYDKLKNHNKNINEFSEHGYYIWHNDILYLYVYNEENKPVVVQKRNMINTFTKRYLYHPIFFMNGSISYDGVLFDSDELIDCQEDDRFDIFWNYEDMCDEFYGDIVCVDTLLDKITKSQIYNKKEKYDDSDDTNETDETFDMDNENN